MRTLHRGPSRVSSVIGVAVVSMLALAGCGSADETAEATPSETATASETETASETAAPVEEAAWPRTFTNADGTTTEIPSQPETILSTSVSLTGTFLAVGAPVVASGSAGNGQFFAQWADVAEERGVQNVWSAQEVDLEAAYAVQPDLIVVSTSGADSLLDQVAEFQAIAPTIILDYGGQTWQELAVQVGEVTGLEDQAADVIAQFDEYVAEAATQITVPDGEANIISFNGAGQDNPIAKLTGVHAQLLGSLGFTIEDPDPAWHSQDSDRLDFVWASYENLTELTAETTFILSKDNEGAKAFLEDPVLANVPSVQAGQVYGLGVNSFRIDYFSATEIVEGVLANFGH